MSRCIGLSPDLVSTSTVVTSLTRRASHWALDVSTPEQADVGVQVYADLWRDDLCLDVAQIIEDAVGIITPIDPRRS
jgi:hypothetical protein